MTISTAGHCTMKNRSAKIKNLLTIGILRLLAGGSRQNFTDSSSNFDSRQNGRLATDSTTGLDSNSAALLLTKVPGEMVCPFLPGPSTT